MNAQTCRRRDVLGAFGGTLFTPAMARAGWSEPPASAVVDPTRLGRLDALLDRLTAKGQLAGASVQIAQHGKVLHEHFSGMADISARRTFAPDTLLRIYSMTKPIAAAAVMLLYEDGALLLNDPVTKYVPEFSQLKVATGESDAGPTTEPARPMTIAHLLTHTSGLSNSWNPGRVSALYAKAGLTAGAWIHDPAVKGLPGFAERLSRVPLEFQPGTRWLYSYGPDVAGLVVERASGLRFGEFLRRRLFEPLGMRDTAFYAIDGARLAAVYETRGGRLARNEDAVGSPFLRPPAAESGAAGLVSTLGDYGRFAQMLACGGSLAGARILSPAGAALMMASQTPREVLGDSLVKFAPFGLGGDGHGLGFALGGAVVTDAAAGHSLSVVGEYTWGGAASTTFWVTPKLNLSVVFMTQFTPSGALPLRDWLKAAVYQALV